MEVRRPHSTQYLDTHERDFWWNADFIALVAQRAGLARATTVLDVGCGQGHWIRMLLPVLVDAAEIVGVDPEELWLARAREGAPAHVTFQRATAEALPFPDASFDLVTCQTVLIHVCDCAVALREMLRVLRPGGTLLLAEPSNLGSALVHDSTGRALADRLRLAEIQARCEEGKRVLGEGDNSIGDLLPGLVAALGCTDIRVDQSDRGSPLAPPYADPAQQALIAQLRELAAREVWIWEHTDTERYFAAGGGTDFAPAWGLVMESAREVVRAIDAGTYHTAGGGLHYVITARKPGPL